MFQYFVKHQYHKLPPAWLLVWRCKQYSQRKEVLHLFSLQEMLGNYLQLIKHLRYVILLGKHLQLTEHLPCVIFCFGCSKATKFAIDLVLGQFNLFLIFKTYSVIPSLILYSYICLGLQCSPCLHFIHFCLPFVAVTDSVLSAHMCLGSILLL